MTSTIERAPSVTRAPTDPPRWRQRPELDGLRTVAVYLVVLFHANVALFAGGFIGVDLFFVLSGFLVSSILFDETARHGKVDVGAFFARRVRRLLPAAVVVVVATSLVSVLTSSVVARLPWVGDAQSALLYVSNWHFLSESDDYFGSDIVRSPFLHFWSLSIEEQFYAGFALLLLLVLLAARRTGRWRSWFAGLMVLLAVGSVASQVYWGSHDPSRAYYATDARIYQMLVGVLGALLWVRIATARQAPGRRAPVRRLPGAALVVLALLVVVATSAVAVSASTRGLVATAVGGPLILIVMTDVDPAARWLLTRPVMTYLGRISYGTYLWHWPVVLVLGAVFSTGPLVLAVLTAGIATGLAALSFEVLEHPIRSSRRLAAVRFPTVAVGVTVSALVAVSVVPPILTSDRTPAIARHHVAAPGGTALPRGPVPAGLPWQAYVNEHGLPDSACSSSNPSACLLHQGSGPRVLLVGDSHGRVLGRALLDLARKHDFTLFGSVMSACSWFPGTTSPTQTETQRAACHAARADLYPDLVRTLHVEVVVATQMPRSWLQWDAHPGEPYQELGFGATQDVAQGVEEAGARLVIVTSMLRTVPDPLACLSTAHDMRDCEMVQRTRNEPFDDFYLAADAASRDVATIDVNRVMCPGYPLCAAVLDGLPVWRDELHYLPATLVARDAGIWRQLLGTGYFDAAQ